MRQCLARLGMPWEDVDARFRYGSLVLAHESERELHVRLRLPRTAESARALKRVVFDERRWPAGIPGDVVFDEHEYKGETALDPAVLA